MSTSNVNVTLFARNVEWDFFSDFQTPCRYRPTMALPALIEALSVESEKTWNPLWNGAMFQPCSECLTTCLDHNNKDRNPWRKTNLRIVEEIAFFRLFFAEMLQHIVWKSSKMFHFNFLFRHFPLVFVPLKVWAQTSDFSKIVKIDNFWHFQWAFVRSKCERCSLRSQCWMRLFLWFSNTVCNAVKFNFL